MIQTIAIWLLISFVSALVYIVYIASTEEDE